MAEGQEPVSGYGSADDEALRALIRVEEQVALSRSLLPTGPGTLHCLECGESIAEARRKAMPGCTYCVDCQAASHDNRPQAKEPWAT